jgi:hypothetical protein
MILLAFENLYRYMAFLRVPVSVWNSDYLRNRALAGKEGSWIQVYPCYLDHCRKGSKREA